MVKLYDGGAYLVNGTEIVPEAEAAKVEALTGKKAEKSEARKGHHGLRHHGGTQHIRKHGKHC